MHRTCIIYSNMLMWLPKRSLIREKYARMLGSGPQLLAGLAESWGAVEHIMHHPGHVLSTAFSYDGTRVVSGLDDNTIRICNASIGEME